MKELKNHNAQQTSPGYLDQDDVYLLTGLLIIATIECVLPFFFSGGFLWAATKNMCDAFFCNKIIEKAISIGDSIKTEEIDDSFIQINSLLRTVILQSLNTDLAQANRYNQGLKQLQITNKINQLASDEGLLTLFSVFKKEGDMFVYMRTPSSLGDTAKDFIRQLALPILRLNVYSDENKYFSMVEKDPEQQPKGTRTGIIYSKP